MEYTDAYIERVLKECGVHIPPNDPLRLLIPILHQCKDDLREAQQETLQLFQSALEEEHEKWSKESLARAETIVSAGLTAVRDTAVTMFKQAEALELEKIATLIDNKLATARAENQRVQHFALLNLFCAIVLVATALAMFFLK